MARSAARNAQYLRRLRLRAIRKTRENVRKQLAKEAETLVRLMRTLNPMPGTISIDWTWGRAPRGATAMASETADGLRITIYATAVTSDYPGGFPAVARWAEFGTARRVQKTTGRSTGQIVARPYFYPAFRALRSDIKRRLRAAVARAFKAASKEVNR